MVNTRNHYLINFTTLDSEVFLGILRERILIEPNFLGTKAHRIFILIKLTGWLEK